MFKKNSHTYSEKNIRWGKFVRMGLHFVSLQKKIDVLF